MADFTRQSAFKGVAANLLILKPQSAFGYSAVSFGIIGTGGRSCYVGSHMARDSRAWLAAMADKGKTYRFGFQ